MKLKVKLVERPAELTLFPNATTRRIDREYEPLRSGALPGPRASPAGRPAAWRDAQRPSAVTCREPGDTRRRSGRWSPKPSPSPRSASVCDGKDVALGTVVGADGLLVTKFSELKGKSTCGCKDGKELDGQGDRRRAQARPGHAQGRGQGLKAVEWRDSKKAEAGDWLASAGHGRDVRSAVGVVSVPTRRPQPTRLPECPPAGRTAASWACLLEHGDGPATIVETEPRTPRPRRPG